MNNPDAAHITCPECGEVTTRGHIAQTRKARPISRWWYVGIWLPAILVDGLFVCDALIPNTPAMEFAFIVATIIGPLWLYWMSTLAARLVHGTRMGMMVGVPLALVLWVLNIFVALIAVPMTIWLMSLVGLA